MTEIVEHQISLSNVEAIGHTHPSQTRINGTFDPSLAQRPQTSSGADEEEDEGSAPPIPHPHPHRSPKTPSTSLLPISSPTNWQQQPEGELAYVEPAHLAPRSRSPLPPFPDPHFDSLYALQEILRLAPVDHSPRPRAPSSPSSSCPSSSSPPRAARLFWWGFAFPPLWLIGLSHLHPSCCPSPTSASSSPCSPPRLVAKLRGRGELELGKTALVIIPHGSNLEKSDQPSHLDGDWNPLSESPAERFVSAGHTNFQALEGFVPDAQFPPGHLRDERRWAYRCLIAIGIALGIITLALVISHQESSRLHHQSGPETVLAPTSASGSSNSIGGSVAAASRSSSPL